MWKGGDGETAAAGAREDDRMRRFLNAHSYIT